MGSKFLESGDATDLTSLQDGSFPAYLSSLKVDDTTPGQTVRMNADKKLVSTLIEQSDLNFTLLTNPNTSNLVSDGLEVTAGNELKTNTINATTGTTITTNSKISVVGQEIETTAGVIAERVFTSKLFGDVGTTDIGVYNDLDLNASGVKLDIKNVSGVSAETLNITGTSNMGEISVIGGNIETTAGVIAERVFTSKLFGDSGTADIGVYNDLDMNASGAKLNISNAGIVSATSIDTTTLDAGNINITGSTVTSTGVLEFKSGASDRVNFKADNGILSIENNNLGGNVELEFAQFGQETFTILKDSSKVNICQSGVNTIELTTDCFGTNKKVILDPTVGATGNAQFRDYGVDMNNNDITNVGTISTGTLNCSVIQPPGSTIINTSGSNFINASAYRGILLDVNTINDLSGSGVSVTSEFKMNSNNISDVGNLEVVSVNDLTPVGGIYSGISDGATISSSTFTDLLPISSVGGLSVAADEFKIGSAFHLVCSGIFPSEDGNDNVEIELCAIQGATTIQLGIVNLELENFDTEPSNFELEADFVIRSIGASGQVAVSFDFTFNKKVTKDFKGTRATNLATINTEVASTLALNARIIGGNGSSIKSSLAYLRKQY